jgi:hypothetical protein
MSYYVVKVYGLDCDVEGCGETIEAIPLIDSPRKLDEVRRQLAQPPDSWTYRDGKDLCPRHSKRS